MYKVHFIGTMENGPTKEKFNTAATECALQFESASERGPQYQGLLQAQDQFYHGKHRGEDNLRRYSTTSFAFLLHG